MLLLRILDHCELPPAQSHAASGSRSSAPPQRSGSPPGMFCAEIASESIHSPRTAPGLGAAFCEIG